MPGHGHRTATHVPADPDHHDTVDHGETTSVTPDRDAHDHDVDDHDARGASSTSTGICRPACTTKDDARAIRTGFRSLASGAA
jgi:hypothetical protein